MSNIDKIDPVYKYDYWDFDSTDDSAKIEILKDKLSEVINKINEIIEKGE